MNDKAVAAPGQNTIGRASEKINLTTLVDLLEVSTVTEKTDLGSAVVYKAAHPELGNIVLINTSGAASAIVYA